MPKPQLKRYSELRKKVDNDLFNQNRTYIDTNDVKTKTEFNFADIFSGCGGSTLGFKKAKFKPILSVEVDEDASNTYKNNFPSAYHFEEHIEKLTDQEILEAVGNKQVHVLFAGFPCKGFSIAGARKSDDERNHLYNQFVRVANLLDPWFVVGENVPSIATMTGESGKNFHKEIIDAFADIGYPDMTVKILESAEHGVPQLRPRAIFVGNRFEISNPYPKPIYSEENYVSIGDAIDDLKDHPRDASINHRWTRHRESTVERISEVGPGESLYDSYQDAWKRQYKGVPAMTVKENHGGVHIHHELDRTISAREMARLQSFPDDFIFSGRMKRVMAQIGNAVPPLLAKHVALALRPALNKVRNKLSEATEDTEPLD